MSSVASKAEVIDSCIDSIIIIPELEKRIYYLERLSIEMNIPLHVLMASFNKKIINQKK